MAEVGTPERPATPTLNAQISNLIVGLLSEHAGRGPTKVRTYVSDDLITTVLRDTLTKGERSLVRQGEAALVLANRRAYQRMIRDDLVAGVERLSNRTVLAVLSDDQIEPEIAVTSIVLAPD